MASILLKIDPGLLLRLNHEVSLASKPGTEPSPGTRTRLAILRELIREALDTRALRRGEPILSFVPMQAPAPRKLPHPDLDDLDGANRALDAALLSVTETTAAAKMARDVFRRARRTQGFAKARVAARRAKEAREAHAEVLEAVAEALAVAPPPTAAPPVPRTGTASGRVRRVGVPTRT